MNKGIKGNKENKWRRNKPNKNDKVIFITDGLVQKLLLTRRFN
jgi:hypothetical protein